MILSGIVAVALCFFAASSASAATIKVGVATNVASGTILGNGLILTDGSGKRYSVNSGARVTAFGSAVRVNGISLPLPVRIAGSDTTGWDKTRYRGSLVLAQSSKGFSVINDVDLESYLRGILKIEMNPEWAPEALKAQAILARTFAVKNAGRHRSQGFDLCDESHCQNYRGVNGEDPRTDAAVLATSGKVLRWNGQVASIYYHSDSGGATSDVSNVWGGSSPYLVSRPEPAAYTSPYSTWSAGLTQKQIDAAAAKLNARVGSVRSVQVAARDSSGRVTSLILTGTNGSARVKGHDFRTAVGSNIIRSTNFQIGANAGALPAAPVPQAPQAPAPVSSVEISAKSDPLVQLTKMDIFTSKELMDMLMNPDKRDEYLKIGLARAAGKIGTPAPVPQNPAPAPVPTPQPTPSRPTATGDFVFSGRGWGHGVGLSQWGAKALADQGWSAEQILAHYFPGTKVN